MKASHFSPDIIDFFSLLHKHGVRYLVVGGEATIYHGHARLTGDVDVFYELSKDNADKLFSALQEFWSVPVPGVASSADFLEQGAIVQFGVPPNRLDLLNAIDGVSFSECWPNRVEEAVEVGKQRIPIYFIGLDDLIRNKRAAGRPRDEEDLKYLCFKKHKGLC